MMQEIIYPNMEDYLHILLTAYSTALFESVEAFFLPGWKNLIGI